MVVWKSLCAYECSRRCIVSKDASDYFFISFYFLLDEILPFPALNLMFIAIPSQKYAIFNKKRSVTWILNISTYRTNFEKSFSMVKAGNKPTRCARSHSWLIFSSTQCNFRKKAIEFEMSYVFIWFVPSQFMSAHFWIQYRSISRFHCWYKKWTFLAFSITSASVSAISQLFRLECYHALCDITDIEAIWGLQNNAL